MKLIIAILLASLPALGSDIRTIGQTKVDLQPIHDWKAAKAASSKNTKEAKELGERPSVYQVKSSRKQVGWWESAVNKQAARKH